MRKKADQEEELAPCLLPTQQKLTELQTGKKSLEGQVETLRTAKEEAEKPEKEAKDQHQKRWEGRPQRGRKSRAPETRPSPCVCFSCPTCLVIFRCALAIGFGGPSQE